MHATLGRLKRPSTGAGPPVVYLSSPARFFFSVGYRVPGVISTVYYDPHSGYVLQRVCRREQRVHRVYYAGGGRARGGRPGMHSPRPCREGTFVFGDPKMAAAEQMLRATHKVVLKENEHTLLYFVNTIAILHCSVYIIQYGSTAVSGPGYSCV